MSLGKRRRQLTGTLATRSPRSSRTQRAARKAEAALTAANGALREENERLLSDLTELGSDYSILADHYDRLHAELDTHAARTEQVTQDNAQLHRRTEELTRQHEALRHQNSGLREQNEELHRGSEVLIRQYEALRHQNSDLREQQAELRHGTAALVQDRDSLLEQLRQKAIHEAQSRGELVDDDRRAHRDLINAYVDLVELRLPQVATELFRFPRRERERLKVLRLEARAVCLLCRVLFERPGDFANERAALAWLHGQDLAEAARPPYPLFTEVAADARRLLTSMAANRYPAVFGAGPLAALEPGRTAQLWSSCPPGGLIEFVVAPAYLVEGGPEGAPWVFTGAAA